MQDELRGPRLGRRYFGRDLTNLDEPNHFTSNEVPMYGEFAKQGGNTQPFKQMQYKPLTRNKSGTFQSTHHVRGYGSHIPLTEGNHIEYDNPFKGRPSAARVQFDHMKNDRQSIPPPLPQWETCDDEEDVYEQPKPRQAPQAHDQAYTAMQTEELPIGYPQIPNLIRETDNVFNFGKKMNFPGCDFENFNGIPFANIWSHLIFKRVVY